MDTLQINGNQRSNAADTASSQIPSPSVEQSDYILIKTTGPFNAQQLTDLEQAEVEILEYKGDDIYLCGYKPKTLTPVTEGLSSFVTHAEVYDPNYVIEPVLRAGNPEGDANINIALHDNVSSQEALDKVRNDVASLVGVPASDIEISDNTIFLSVPKTKLEELAQVDQVKSINEFHRARVFNNEACKIMGVSDATGKPNTTYKGAGQVVCVCDTGFDTGDASKCHEAFGKQVTKLYSLGRTTQNLSDDPDGHGTHVCGSVIGKGTHATEGSIEAPASEATLLMQSTFSGWNKVNPSDPSSRWKASLQGLDHTSYSDLFGIPAQAGARIHTNSWGSNNPGCLYDDTEAGVIDDYLWQNQDLVVLFAAGNNGVDSGSNKGRIDESSLCRESCAKNTIVVGASENLRSKVDYGWGENRPLTWGDWQSNVRNVSKYPNEPLFSDPVANNPEGLAGFSSRGPVKPSGRIKPDVVAPGTTILSTRSSHIEPGHWTDGWGKSSDLKWCYSGGTSMATPLVAGCCAAIRGAFVDNFKVEPSAPLVKALLINGAVPLKGQYPSLAMPNTEFGKSVDKVPNPHYGFGRINLKNSIQNVLSAKDSSHTAGYGDRRQAMALTVSQNEYSFDIAIPSGVGTSSTLKMTLVWNDPKGDQLQHDLNLIISHGAGSEKHGNMGDETGFDSTNNVEQITWKNVAPGTTYKATIKLARGDQRPQPFAYAWRIF